MHENHLDGECSRRGATRGVARSAISDVEVLKPTTAAAVSQFVARDRIMSLLRGVFTRHRDHVVCHTSNESVGVSIAPQRDDLYPSSNSTRIRLSHTRGRVCRGFITEKAGHDLGKPRDIIDISRGIELRFTRDTPRANFTIPAANRRGKGGNYIRGRTWWPREKSPLEEKITYRIILINITWG